MTNSFASKVIINKTEISTNTKPYLVAEIGLNHNKNIELGKKMIEAAAKAGANSVKFQSYTTEKFINATESRAKVLIEVFKQYELSEEEHIAFKKCADSCGIDFFSTALTEDWVESLFQLQVPVYKVASGDLLNFSLLQKIIHQKKPIIVSTGAASWAEIKRSAAFFLFNNFFDVVFLHCVSLYPLSLADVNLNTMDKIRSQLGALSGFSDHTIGSDASFVAAAKGASVIEKHFTLEKTLPGPDHKLSAEPKELLEIRKRIDLAYQINGSSKEYALAEEKKSDFFGKRSLYTINGKLVAMRPRKEDCPKDSDYFDVLSQDR